MADLTDKEITEACARAMGYECSVATIDAVVALSRSYIEQHERAMRRGKP